MRSLLVTTAAVLTGALVVPGCDGAHWKAEPMHRVGNFGSSSSPEDAKINKIHKGTPTRNVTRSDSDGGINDGCDNVVDDVPLYDSTYDDLLDAAVRLGIRRETPKERHAAATPSSTPFAPLSCNEDLTPSQCDPSHGGTLLSEVVESSRSREQVTVPCGTCAYWDYSMQYLDLPNGLNVEGWLHFGSGVDATLRTTHLYVQGGLIIDPPPADHGVTISLYGDVPKYFVPHDENRHACPPGGCEVGAKPFVVAAGGTVDVRGLSERDYTSCERWAEVLEFLPSSSSSSSFAKIAVGSEAARCYDAGDELLLAGHEDRQADAVVRSIDVEAGTLTLSEPLPEDLVVGPGRAIASSEVPTATAGSPAVEVESYRVEMGRMTRRVALVAEEDDADEDGAVGGGRIHIWGEVRALMGLQVSNFDNDVPVPAWVELLKRSVVF